MSESGIWKFLIFDGLETILLQRRESSGTVLASKYFFFGRRPRPVDRKGEVFSRHISSSHQSYEVVLRVT